MKHTLLRMLSLLCAILLMGALCLTGCGNAAPAEETGNKEPAPTTEAPAQDTTPKAHDHKEAAVMRLSYETAADGTFTLIVKDCQGNEVCRMPNLKEKARSTPIIDGITELYWITDKNANNGYHSLYINQLTCQVSEVFYGSQTTDGNRIVYSEFKNNKLSVIVRDLFNKGGYCKTTELTDAYVADGHPVMGITLYGTAKEQANVSYRTGSDGTHRIKAFDLYDNGEEKPAYVTTKTDKK